MSAGRYGIPRGYLPFGLTPEDYLELAIAALDQAGMTVQEVDRVVEAMPQQAQWHVRTLGWFAKKTEGRRWAVTTTGEELAEKHGFEPLSEDAFRANVDSVIAEKKWAGR
jgi:hypothetical protein